MDGWVENPLSPVVVVVVVVVTAGTATATATLKACRSSIAAACRTMSRGWTCEAKGKYSFSIACLLALLVWGGNNNPSVGHDTQHVCFRIPSQLTAALM
jgi:hypothetical protein